MDDYFNGREFRNKLTKYEKAKQEGLSVFLDCDDLIDIAEFYHMQGHDDDAMRVCDEALQIFPDSNRPLIFMARSALLVDNDSDKAEEILGQVSDTSDLDYYYLKAEILIVRHEEKEAASYLQYVYEVLIDEADKPDFVLDVAELMADYSLIEDAQYWLGLSDESGLDDYQEIKGRIAMESGRPEEGERIFTRLLDKNPYSAVWWNRLAMAQSMQGRISDSISSSEYSIAINPTDDEALMNKANGLFSLGNYEEALQYYKRYTAVGDKNLGLAFQGITYMALHDDATAYEYLEKAAIGCPDSHPNKLEIIRQLCGCLITMHRTEDAATWADRMMLLPQSDNDEILAFKGYLYLSADWQKLARDCFSEALTHSGMRPEIVMSVCVAFHDCGFYTQSYELATTFLQNTQVALPFGYAYLADSCMRLHKDREGIEYLRKACELNPEEVECVFADNIPEGVQPSDYWKYLISSKK